MPWKPLGVIIHIVLNLQYVLMFCSSSSLPPRSGVFIFSLWLWCVQDSKGVLGKDVYSYGWDLRGVVGAGSPGTSQLLLLQCVVADTAGEVQRDNSRILMLRAPSNGRGWMSRNLGSSSHYFQSGFNNSAMHCSNTCQALNFDISDLLFATVLTWSSLNCFITAYLPRRDLAPGFPCGFSQWVHGNRPLKIHVKGLWGGQPRWCVLAAGNKCTVFSIQVLWNLIQMNKKWKNETTQRKPLYQDVCWLAHTCVLPRWHVAERAPGQCLGTLAKLCRELPIPLPNSCQEPFNAWMLNLPTLCMYLWELINGQTHLSPLV